MVSPSYIQYTTPTLFLATGLMYRNISFPCVYLPLHVHCTSSSLCLYMKYWAHKSLMGCMEWTAALICWHCHSESFFIIKLDLLAGLSAACPVLRSTHPWTTFLSTRGVDPPKLCGKVPASVIKHLQKAASWFLSTYFLGTGRAHTPDCACFFNEIYSVCKITSCGS